MPYRRSLPPIPRKSRLLFLLAFLLLFGFAATSLVSYFVSRDLIRESIVATELPLTSDNVYSEIQKDLIRPILISSTMARDTYVRDWVLGGEKEPERITRYLKEILTHYGTFTSFFVSEPSRTYYHADGILKKVRPDEARDAWYFRVRKMEEPYEINVDPDLANRDKLTIFINYRVFDYQQQFIGATGVGLTVDAVQNLIHDYQERYGRSIFFTDRSGRIVLTGRHQNHFAHASHLSEIEGLAPLAATILQTEKGSFTLEQQGHRHFLNVRYLPELKWYLFVVKKEDRALSEIRRTLYFNLILCAAITLLVLSIVYLTVSRYQRRLEEAATTDHLTGLNNRHGLQLLLHQAEQEAERTRTPLAAILLDLDHFKRINDHYGHLAGDRLLQEAAKRLRSGLRASDILCRWGGEEFLLILKNSELGSACATADAIRQRMQADAFDLNGLRLHLTLSAGVTLYHPGEDGEDDFIVRADRLLYQAKANGRNQVCSESSGEPPPAPKVN